MKEIPFTIKRNNMSLKENFRTFFISLLFFRVDLTVNKVPMDSIAYN